MNRSDMCLLVEASVTAGRPDYARAVCQAWLASAPGDLGIRFLLAKALAAEKQTADALAQLDAITAADFERASAYRLIAGLAPGKADAARAAALAHILDGQAFPSQFAPPVWMEPARNAVFSLAQKNFRKARQHIDIALRDENAPPLVSLILLKIHWQADEIDLALPLAKGFHDRWPKGVAILLCLVEGLFRSGDSHCAVELLHTVSALDFAGDVVTRYWGAAHPYRDLWPLQPAVNLPGPIPAEVITLLGWNRLGGHNPGEINQLKSEVPVDEPKPVRPARAAGGGKPSRAPEPKSEIPPTPAFETLPESTPRPTYPAAQPTASEELRDIQASLNAIAAQIGSARYQRRPAHVILYSPKLLKAKFGPDAGPKVINLIEELAHVIARRRRVTVVLLAPEAPAEVLGLKPVDPANAWDVKMMLHDLDGKLAQKGRAIGSLLIVGSDDLMPFHRLPNPTDDVDDDVPSDNPYGTSDDNYFIPEWPVGRLPSPCGRDPEPLCRLLRSTIAAHQSAAPGISWARAILFRLLRRWLKQPPPASIGYAASIWKEASLEVFAPISGEQNLHISPPLNSDTAPSAANAQLSYFNLHGIEDGPDWFGQRDMNDAYGPLYPVALKPRPAAEGDADAPKVIFAEACYGANIIAKPEPDAALCLRFLNDGAYAFVGSTKIAYGSIAPPLIGADLLGRTFWDNALAGLPVGEALQRAKLTLAHTMHKRQSFLDGEDQKTLISFVLYGDPLLPAARPTGDGRLGGKKDLPSVNTIAMEYASADEAEIQPDTVAEIKSMLSRYLPGAESAQISLSRPLSPINARSKAAPTHRVYTIAKHIHSAAHNIPAFARVTVTKSGKVVKVAVSR